MKMKIVSTILLVLALWLVGTVLVPSARADEYDKKTVITFSQPFEIPGGKVLPAGTYTFKLMDSPSDRHIVQIFNADGTQIFATILAINNYRLTATGKTVMTFSERPGDSPDALKAWFYPNNNFGQEFVYPKRRAIELAVAEKEPVPALTTDTLPAVAELKTAPIIAITPEKEEVPVAKVIQTAPLVADYKSAELPRTASSVPLIVLLGAASLGFAFVLRRIAG
jgi:hypothetical protein